MSDNRRREVARTLMPLVLLVLLMQAIAPARAIMGAFGDAAASLAGDGICRAMPDDDQADGRSGPAVHRHDACPLCTLPNGDLHVLVPTSCAVPPVWSPRRVAATVYPADRAAPPRAPPHAPGQPRAPPIAS